TTRLIFEKWLTLPLVAVTVRLKVPLATFLLVVIVSVVFPEPVTDDGLNCAWANFGRPLTANVTAPPNPPPAVIVTVYLGSAPAAIVCVAGETDTWKSALITSVTLTLCEIGPLLAVIVTV